MSLTIISLLLPPESKENVSERQEIIFSDGAKTSGLKYVALFILSLKRTFSSMAPTVITKGLTPGEDIRRRLSFPAAATTVIPAEYKPRTAFKSVEDMALFFAAASWYPWEIAIALFCGCMACAVTAAGYRMCRKGLIVLPVLWAAGILAVILLVRQEAAVLTAATVSLLAAVLYLAFADAYDFYSAATTKRAVQHTGHSGSVFVYLTRYLLANKSYLINTVGLCAIACFLPLLFGEFQGLNMFPIGLAILCLNTPICTLLSCDPDMEQAIRVLPGQAGRFCRRYCLFIFIVNGAIAGIYLSSWQIIHGGIELAHVGMVLLFAIQSAILSVMLEWKHPIRGWKTESDLWHHPRKYIVPLAMLLIAAFVGTYPPVLGILSAVLLMECGILLYTTRRE